MADKKEIIINGNNFSNLEEFYNEIDRVLTKELDFKTGHNLNAFNDLLRGGFGVHEYDEPIHLKWENSQKSKLDLGYNATLNFYTEVLEKCHPSNINSVKKKIELAKAKEGQTLFDILVEIIMETDNCTLTLL